MTAKAGVKARVHAARAVDAVLNQHGNLDQALAASHDLDPRDRALAQALAYGALRTHERNRWLLSQLLEKPLRKRDSLIEALLSVALFALTESQRPDYAVVSVSVDAAKQLGQPRLGGLVNAVLRRFLRESDSLLAAAQLHATVRWQHPQWLIDAMQSDWPDHWENILSAANAQPPMWLRVNAAKTTRADWLAALPDTVPIDSVPEIPASAVCLTTPVNVSELPGFAEGLVSVQDAAAQLAAELLDAQPGMRVLDACAAPGGKTAHLLERTPQLAELVALDISASRLKRVQENLSRLSLKATLLEADVLAPEDWAKGRRFERILLDAPCSATGVIRRHPDIRYLRQPADIARFATTQLEMLQRLWPLLAPGGALLYVTCSVMRAENADVVSAFLAATPDAQVVDPGQQAFGLHGIKAGPGYQLLPGSLPRSAGSPAATDGFYYALMSRAS